MLLNEFKKIIPEKQHGAMLHWWNALGVTLQEELQSFYVQGEQVAAIVANINEELFTREQRYLEAQELADLADHDFPNQDYYENLIGNDIYLCLRGPVFHICKAHPDLRLMLLLGLLPRRFSCYVGNRDCAMAENLDAGDEGFWSLSCVKRQDGVQRITRRNPLFSSEGISRQAPSTNNFADDSTRIRLVLPELPP
ncbi:MAG TPA: hypothetical protein VF472_04690 [Burkholderiaceae bacterium]